MIYIKFFFQFPQTNESLPLLKLLGNVTYNGAEMNFNSFILDKIKQAKAI